MINAHRLINDYKWLKQWLQMCTIYIFLNLKFHYFIENPGCISVVCISEQKNKWTLALFPKGLFTELRFVHVECGLWVENLKLFRYRHWEVLLVKGYMKHYYLHFQIVMCTFYLIVLHKWGYSFDIIHSIYISHTWPVHIYP